MTSTYQKTYLNDTAEYGKCVMLNDHFRVMTWLSIGPADDAHQFLDFSRPNESAHGGSNPSSEQANGSGPQAALSNFV